MFKSKIIDLFHNGSQVKYSFVLMLISLSSLATTSKFQKNICVKMRAVGLISIKTKECKSGHHLWKWSIPVIGNRGSTLKYTLSDYRPQLFNQWIAYQPDKSLPSG